MYATHALLPLVLPSGAQPACDISSRGSLGGGGVSQVQHGKPGEGEHRGGRGGTAEGWGGIVKVLLAFGKLPLKHN